jgi:hypothetical protein
MNTDWERPPVVVLCHRPVAPLDANNALPSEGLHIMVRSQSVFICVYPWFFVTARIEAS